ncbi:MAG: hypothetical protein A2W91_18815 [Bacteroidetes bacterium GWF2_38_335]|nr:MAG: hypothetical protein A2W91_18815 [Bacteroidetes bacterium GWF2_38_335]OFY78149.1 MAG: hypothetical protein A2281_04250 [Bacteroidetes bacterium RIFOXYA12_FULL_38_20]HBS88695.1 hypothetical protein [Bacteroidales bacterium]
MFLKDSVEQKDLEKLVEIRAEESLSLEFVNGSELNPASESKTGRITILISAFANTAGGTIIYGIETRKKRASGFSFVNGNEVSKEWLEQLASSRITKNIPGLKIHSVAFDNDPLKSVFVIIVPDSPLAPHMNHDYRFYKRSGFKEHIMEEHEVRMKYLQTNVAEIEFFGVINTNGIPLMNDGKLSSMSFYPKFLIRNISKNIEHSYKTEISVPADLYDSSFTYLQEYFVRHDGNHNVFSVPNRSPLFQEEMATALELKLTVNKNNFEVFENEEIHVKIFYSNGIKSHSFNLRETFRYKNKNLNIDDFGLAVIDKTSETNNTTGS